MSMSFLQLVRLHLIDLESDSSKYRYGLTMNTVLVRILMEDEKRDSEL